MSVEATGTLVFYFNRDEALYALFLNFSETSFCFVFSLHWLSSIARTGRITFALSFEKWKCPVLLGRRSLQRL